MRAGVAITCLTSHGHVHLLPPLRHVVVRLLDDFSIPEVRVVRRARSARGIVFGGCSAALIRALRRKRSPVVFPDRIIGLGYRGTLTRARLIEDLASLAEGVAELVVHPASAPNEYHRRWRYAGEQEFEILLANDTASLLRRCSC